VTYIDWMALVLLVLMALGTAQFIALSIIDSEDDL
jgi:hypothetical protein